MSITYPLASPTSYGLSALQWGGVTNTSRVKAPFTLQDITQVYDGAMWRGTLDIATQWPETGRALTAWITSLQGQRGTFELGDPAAPTPLGSAKTTPGTPLVKGGSQTGAVLAVDGLPNSVSGYLLPGDYIQVTEGGIKRLHMVLESVTSNGSGEASISIWPQLRASPTDNSAIVLTNPVGIFALTQPFTPWTVRTSGLVYDGVRLSVEEVL